MNIMADILFGLVMPYFVLPALLIYTIVKMRSLWRALALLTLVIAAFYYGYAMGIHTEIREDRQRQHTVSTQAQPANNHLPEK